MTTSIHHSREDVSNQARDLVARVEPRSLRTFTPSQAVLARSAGIFYWTPEGRRLFDFTSGVLVANLGHNPASWINRFVDYLGWSRAQDADAPAEYLTALPMNAYNAVTDI